ncbi:MAG: tetratricopeptide (TPR) repeat protein [Candidatus Azotimanducaceae bacterium]|jgi:tetratricopeptide (TPR) repeat protein
MSTKLAQAQQLATNKKFKKALQIVKKITPKTTLEKYQMLEIEALCHFNIKNYQIALLKTELALSCTDNTEKKLYALNNLAILSEKLNQQLNAIEYFRQYLAIDNSLNSTKQRYKLITLAFSVADYATVEKYAPLLSNVMEYATEATLILAQAAINNGQYDEALTYLSKVSADIKTEGVLAFSQKQITTVLNGFHKVEAFVEEASLLKTLENNYKHEKWYQDLKTRLVSINKVTKQVDESPNPVIEPFTNNGGVIGSNIQVVYLVKKLIVEMESMGAFFHEKIQINENKGEISVCLMQESITEELLMEAPTKCMPFIKDYRFTLDKNNKITFIAKKNMLNPYAKKIMSLVLDLFNACNKIESWKLSYPLFALAGYEELIDNILFARVNRTAYVNYKADKIENISDEAVIQSFFGSRTMSFSDACLRQIGSKTKNVSEQAIIPVIELINHHMSAPAFQRDNKTNNLQTFSGLGKAGREVFVRYNLDDPLITFLTYGFVDQSAQWIYSVPVSLKTKVGINITIYNYQKALSVELTPNHLLGVNEYLPASITRKGKYAIVSKLIIPAAGEATIMQAVLTHLLQSIDLEGAYNNPKNLEIEIQNLEEQLIKKNRMYWTNLKVMTLSKMQSTNPPPKFATEQLVELCEFCINHINQYYASTGHIITALK